MASNYLEIKRFLKDYRLFILAGTIIFTILFALGASFLEQESRESSEQPPSSETNTVQEYDSEELLNESQPAFFQFYIEENEGGTFTNSAIINQYFNLDSVMNEAEEATGVPLNTISSEIQEEYPEEDIYAVHVSRNEYSGLMTTAVNTGDEEDNLTVADYYYDLIQSGEIEFLLDKEIFYFITPTLAGETSETVEGAADEETEDQTAGTAEAESGQEENDLVQNLLINGLIGLALGAALTVGIAFVKELFSSRLNYSFAYDVDENKNYYLYDKKLANEASLAQHISVPYGEKKVIVSENRLSDEAKALLSGKEGVSFSADAKVQLVEVDSLVNVEADSDYAEIIIVIAPHQTARKWYKTQNKLKDLFTIPAKVVQLNQQG